MPQHVTIVNYNPTWEHAYSKEEKRIKQMLKENCAGIRHIGRGLQPN